MTPSTAWRTETAAVQDAANRPLVTTGSPSPSTSGVAPNKWTVGFRSMDDRGDKPSQRRVGHRNRGCFMGGTDSRRGAAPSGGTMKNLKKTWLLAPLVILGVACGKTATDDTLKNDLALASQAQQYAPQQVISPTEQGLAANSYTTPVQRVSRAPAPIVRRATAPRSSGSSAGQVVYQPAPQPTVKHTTRDL